MNLPLIDEGGRTQCPLCLRMTTPNLLSNHAASCGYARFDNLQATDLAATSGGSVEFSTDGFSVVIFPDDVLV